MRLSRWSGICRPNVLFNEKLIISSLHNISKRFMMDNPNQDDSPHATVQATQFQQVSEGKATIVQPESVFYNPVQQFNRDITIAFISEFAKDHLEHVKEQRLKKNELDTVTDDMAELVVGKSHPNGLRILEGLGASGLRSVRFGLEIPGVKKIVCNDFDKQAAEVIQRNIDRNNLQHLVEASCADASMLMYQNKRFEDRFDVVDLDPYGTAVPFFDAAVQAVRDGGLLCVTCTDAAVLCGANVPEKCFTMYGSMPVKSRFCHEMALRVILRCLEAHASKYSRYIVPLASLSVDFYFRIFVKVYTGQLKAKFSAAHTGMVYHCPGCGSFITQPLSEVSATKGDNYRFSAAKGPKVSEVCVHCGSHHRIGGPMYLGPLHDRGYMERVIGHVLSEPGKFGTAKRIEGMLSMAGEELDTPLYWEIDGLYQTVHCEPMKLVTIMSAVLNAGYQVSYSHACKNSLKTDAPNSVIWDIIRAHVKNSDIKTKRNVPGTPGYKILSVPPSLEVNFDTHPDAVPKSCAQNLLRFQPNPQENWGPKPRAKRQGDDDAMVNRRLQNQGKKKRKLTDGNEDSSNNKDCNNDGSKIE
ncbi:tRNA (guanine(26)-N(2))-dimethyltransferase-like isoform X2 [Dreissena polymorpha]|nr:tRNA (guanine(26)-N(2))-dimethyltransferase-like isoform X2 [Dreissena polymorpha]KAH3833055.1 hypothetical protein DPMN_106356 [Dreissena polymorpha]